MIKFKELEKVIEDWDVIADFDLHSLDAIDKLQDAYVTKITPLITTEDEQEITILEITVTDDEEKAKRAYEEV